MLTMTVPQLGRIVREADELALELGNKRAADVTAANAPGSTTAPTTTGTSQMRRTQPCQREGCRKNAHPLDPYCSRLCAEVDRGFKDVSAIAEHEKWLRNHRPGAQPLSTTNVAVNVANAREQGGATWASDAQ